MKGLVAALSEIYGLFVEDGTYAVSIIIWLLICAFVLPHVAAQSWRAPLMFVGFLVTFVENVVRSARQP